MNKGTELDGARMLTRKTKIRAGAALGSLGLLVSSLLSAGCAAPAAMSSSVRYAGPTGGGKIVQVLNVAKPAEDRPDKGASRIGAGFLTFIPLVPYGAQRFTPERYFANATMMTYDFRDDLSQTVVKDLSAAGVAQAVGPEMQGWGNGAVTGVHRIELSLKEGTWHRNITTYGCSVLGVYLWLVGLPVSYGDSDMAFEATVIAPDGKELGRRTFKAQMPLTESAYVPHKFPKQLPLLYEKISPEFRNFVVECLNRSPLKGAVPCVAAQGPDGQVANRAGGSVAERLKELKTLKDSGMITEEEFQAKRKKLVEAL